MKPTTHICLILLITILFINYISLKRLNSKLIDSIQKESSKVGLINKDVQNGQDNIKVIQNTNSDDDDFDSVKIMTNNIKNSNDDEENDSIKEGSSSKNTKINMKKGK